MRYKKRWIILILHIQGKTDFFMPVVEKKCITFKYHKGIIQQMPDLFFCQSFNYPNRQKETQII